MAVLVSPAIWIGLTIAFHVVSILTGVDGNIWDVFWMTGVGMMPYALSVSLGAVATAIVLSLVPAPETAAEIQSLATTVRSHPLVEITNLLHVGFLLWSGAYWIDIGTEVWDVSPKRAVTVVAGPLAFLIAMFTLMKVV